MFLGIRVSPVREADLIAICEVTVYTMWDPQISHNRTCLYGLLRG
jgi:hypothetical protein